MAHDDTNQVKLDHIEMLTHDTTHRILFSLVLTTVFEPEIFKYK
jgi:hypothetical protein